MRYRLTRFPEQYRNELTALAAQSERIGQLSSSTPLLFYAIATGHGTPTARRETIRRAENGRPLRAVCAPLAIPYALRRIEPEALQDGFTPCTLSERAAQRLVNRISRLKGAASMSRVLAAASYGARICHDEFAVWLADQRNVSSLPKHEPERLRPLALYAWASSQNDLLPPTVWRRLWSPDMGWSTAVTEARLWFDYLKFYLYFAPKPIDDPWARAEIVSGFEFVPLMSFEQLIGEVRDMENCLYSYADRLKSNRCRLFGVRRNGYKLGTIELHRAADGLHLAEFRGPGNARMSLEAWHAAHAWLARQPVPARRRRRKATEPSAPDLLSKLVATHAGHRALPEDFWRRPPTLENLSAELIELQEPRLAMLMTRDRLATLLARAQERQAREQQTQERQAHQRRTQQRQPRQQQAP